MKMKIIGGAFQSFSCLVIQCLIIQTFVRYSIASYCYQNYLCTSLEYTTESYVVECGFWNWGRCNRYRLETNIYYRLCTRSFCCPGYTGTSCSQAICHGSISCPNGGTCIRPDYCECQPGFSSPQCTDINECLLDNGGCNQYCFNTFGSYYCGCSNGFVLTDSKTCTDINECLVHNGGCSQICINTDGSHECKCNAGFVLEDDGRSCTDIDECLMSNTCSQMHGCTNTIGSYNCTCDSGFFIGTDNASCVETNECAVDNGGCDHRCINLPSTYRCECESGYSLNNDSKTCTDIDECSAARRCSHLCNNTIGSYICSCFKGFILGSDGSSCDDIDNCVDVTCFNGGRCVDGKESYSCKCLDGFDGIHCEIDRDECAFLNGGCENTCINTVGSFYCECQPGIELDEDGFSCRANNSEKQPSIFEIYKIPLHLLPRGCAYIALNYSLQSQPNVIIKLSSTADWFSPVLNGDVLYTYGIVFLEVNDIALPISVSGIEISRSEKDVTIKHGSIEHTGGVRTSLQEKRLDNCFSFPITPKDVVQLLRRFLPTVFNNINRILPNWIRFSESGTDILSVRDLKGDILYGKELRSDQECKGAPVINERLYVVFRLGTDIKISLYGNGIHIPHPLPGNKFCLILDIGVNSLGTMFIILPEESRDVINNFQYFTSLKGNGLTFRPVGIGLSIQKNINVDYKSNEIEIWNSDSLINIPVFPTANIWMFTNIFWQTKTDVLEIKVSGGMELYFSFPKMSTVLTGIYAQEWNGLVQLKSGLTTFTINVLNLFTIEIGGVLDFSAYLSIGGQSERKFCDENSNPAGIFASLSLTIAPFKNIPILKEWNIDFTARAHIFLLSANLNNNQIELLGNLRFLKNVMNKLKNSIEAFLPSLGQTVLGQTESIFLSIKNRVISTEDTLTDAISKISLNKMTVFEVTDILLELWSIYVNEVQELLQKIIISFEYDESLIKHNITSFIQNIDSEFKNGMESTISNLRDQTFSVIKSFKGFGLRLTANIRLISLDFPKMEIEVIGSQEGFLGQCSKYKTAFDLMKAEPTLRVYGKLSQTYSLTKSLALDKNSLEGKLGRFISVDFDSSVSLATSNTGKFVAVLHGGVSVLGLYVFTDIIITNTLVKINVEGNIWDIFFARLSIAADMGVPWYELALKVDGKLDVKGDDKNFGKSYLDGLMMLTEKIAREANARLSSVQDFLSAMQNALSSAQKSLSTAQIKIRSCNSAFDTAVQSFEKAKDALEKAKGPFQRAVETLNKAQRNVDNLCRIRNCPGICIPGIVIKWCRRGWFGYPCIKVTSCMFRIPDIFCHLANLACYAVRAIAYVALEVAKIFVRIPMLALDAAKIAVSAAQFIVDKSRVVLVLAEGVLEVAKVGLDVAKVALEAAKIALELVKGIVWAAVHVFNLIIKYGLQNIIDVRNCRFALQLAVFDQTKFDVSCEVQAFKLPWTTIGFEFDFKNPLLSLWKITSSTIEILINMVKNLFGKRKKRDIEFKTMTKMHHIIHRLKREADNFNSSSFSFNETVSSASHEVYLKNKFDNRIDFFAFQCDIFLNVHSFLTESISRLQNMTNDSVVSINNVYKHKEAINDTDINVIYQNFTAQNLGISPEYALKDYNITEDELQDILIGVNDSFSNDPIVIEMSNSSRFAKETIDSQTSQVESLGIIQSWISSLTNFSIDFFTEEDCAGYQDCVLFSFSELFHTFSNDSVADFEEIRLTISILQSAFQSIILNMTRSITDSNRLSIEILEHLDRLNKSNVFCAEIPNITSKPQNITALLGSTVKLACDANGNPKPNIYWYHNENLLEYDDYSVVQITNITKEHEGKYQCTAGNIVTNVTSDIAFIVVTECKPGLYYNSEECVMCEKGYYQTDWNMQYCTKCPFGHSTDQSGSAFYSDCSVAKETIVITVVSSFGAVLFFIVLCALAVKHTRMTKTFKIRQPSKRKDEQEPKGETHERKRTHVEADVVFTKF